jgi:predicted Zn-dependent protease
VPRHEIAHAAAYHGAERMSQQMAAQVGGNVAGALTLGSSQLTQEVVGEAYGAAAQVGVLLPFSRKQEAEADHIGMICMARAGYDPAEAIAFWQRFAEYNL